MERLAYRPAEAATALGISRSRIYELITEGRLTKRKIGKVSVIPAESLKALLEEAA